MQTSEISSAATLRPGASDYSEGTDQSVSVSSKVAQLESRLSCISPLRSRSAVSVSLAASNAAQLILACRVASGGLSLCTKRKSLKSPGKTNLDRLLGLGNCDNDASESEGEHTNLKKKCLSASTSRVTDPPNVHCSDNTVLQIDDLSGRVSGLLDTLDFSLHAISESGPAARALTGSTDIFSDEDDDTDDDKNSPLPLFPDETQRLARDLTCSTSGDVTAKERSDISSLVLASPTSRSAAVASESMILVPRSRGRAAVTFSESELSGVQHTESLIQSHPQHEADSTGHALINSELTNGYRRSSRLFRNTMNLSASKNGSNSSNRTSLGSSRFVSTESSQSGKVSMDVMRNDCGYDSYFGSMEFAAQVSSN